MARLMDIVFDCRQPARLARFWSEVLDGYAVAPYDGAELARLADHGLTPDTDPSVLVLGPGPRLWFVLQETTEVRRNKMHLDLQAADLNHETARLVALGARVLRCEAGFTVLADPESNNFCVFAVA